MLEAAGLIKPGFRHQPLSKGLLTVLKYIVKRLLMLIPVLIGVSIIVFVIMRVFSPDPAPIVLGQHATTQMMEIWRTENGLNDQIGRAHV
jgi:peptide/nickel transport system permease protein